jgi:5,10-methylenetetrahydromethanopterin reductase
VGIERRKPLAAMQETIEILRRLLRMENVTFEGEFHRVRGIELDVVHGRREPRTVPVYIGATGDKMMELTGVIADGCLLNYCVPPSYNDRALELLEKGAARAGRKLEDVDRPQLIVCSVDRDRERAIDGAKALIMRKVQSILGWPATKEQVRSAMRHVPDELVLGITATGTPEEARARVAEYVKRGATCPVLYPLGDPFLMMDTFA